MVNYKAIYWDTSALVKLIISEADSSLAYSIWNNEDYFPISSELVITELPRAVGRVTPSANNEVSVILEGLTQITLDRRILQDAAELQPPMIRSLDAIHLASALNLERGLEGVLTFDVRMVEAARSLGIPIINP